MGTTLNRKSFVEVIEGDMKWLKEQPDSLERQHIEALLRDAARVYYDLPNSDLARKDRIRSGGPFAHRPKPVPIEPEDPHDPSAFDEVTGGRL